MAKYKAGDRVIVRDDIIADDGHIYCMEGDKRSHNTFVSGMDKFCGCVVTIESVGTQYFIEECGYSWTDEMFVGLATESCPSVSVVDLL